jgi:Raf kinase inhibitor-like YbhB/YbcL family protein
MCIRRDDVQQGPTAGQPITNTGRILPGAPTDEDRSPSAGSSPVPVAPMAMPVANPPATPTQRAGAPATATGEGGATAPMPAADAKFELMPVDFPMVQGDWAFPPSAIAGSDVSPGWSWTGVPAEAKSLVLVFEDIGISAVKWVVWDIPPDGAMIPAGIDASNTMLSEVPGASQLGSLMRTGYGGPARPDQRYEWTLWALDVDKLPDTEGKTTVDLKAALPMHMVAMAETVIVYNR